MNSIEHSHWNLHYTINSVGCSSMVGMMHENGWGNVSIIFSFFDYLFNGGAGNLSFCKPVLSILPWSYSIFLFLCLSKLHNLYEKVVWWWLCIAIKQAKMKWTLKTIIHQLDYYTTSDRSQCSRVLHFMIHHNHPQPPLDTRYSRQLLL